MNFLSWTNISSNQPRTARVLHLKTLLRNGKTAYRILNLKDDKYKSSSLLEKYSSTHVYILVIVYIVYRFAESARYFGQFVIDHRPAANYQLVTTRAALVRSTTRFYSNGKSKRNAGLFSPQGSAGIVVCGFLWWGFIIVINN